MHHPESLCGSGIDYIDMSSTIIITGPNSINPPRLIKPIHPRLKDFFASVVEVIL
jgi:hypothetical protein